MLHKSITIILVEILDLKYFFYKYFYAFSKITYTGLTLFITFQVFSKVFIYLRPAYGLLNVALIDWLFLTVRKNWEIAAVSSREVHSPAVQAHRNIRFPPQTVYGVGMFFGTRELLQSSGY